MASQNHIFIYGEIGKDVTLSSVISQVDRKAEEIVVHINSNGGSVSEGFAIHDYLKGLGKKVTTVIDGVCYSIASVVGLAGTKRLMQPNSKWMIHNPWVGDVSGDAAFLERLASGLKEEEKRMAAFYANTLNLDKEEIVRLMSNETYFDYAKAIEVGFATGLADELKAVAKLNPNSIIMTTQEKQKATGLMSQLFALFGKHTGIKAMLPITLEDGKTVYIETEDGEVEGKSAYMDESMTTPAPDGVHKLKDGRTITVAGGRITSVALAQAPDPAIAQAMEDKKKAEAEAVALKAALAQKDAQILAMQNDFKAMKAGLDEMKKTILGEGENTQKQTQTAKSGQSGKIEYKGKFYSPEQVALLKKFGTQLNK